MAKIRKIESEQNSIRMLLDGCIKKDQQAQNQLFKQFAPLILTTCRRYGTTYYPAKDLLQDTFIKVFDKIHQFDQNKGKLTSWITRITINLAINAIRDKKIQFTSLIEANQLIKKDEEVFKQHL